MAQWRGFQSIRTLPKELQNDLRDFEDFVRALSVRVAKVTPGEPLYFSTGSGPGSDPTASVGLTVVNGKAATFMRSDAAPPLSQAIAPTWTSAHTFSAGVTLNGTVTLGAAATAAPVNVNLSANAAGSATTISRSDHKHALDQSITPTWTGAHSWAAGTGISLLTSASDYKAITIRDSNAWISSNAANQLDLHATTTLNLNIGVTPSLTITSSSTTLKDAHNIVVGTSTGTKVGTATTQKLALWNATPIVQPANTVAINDVLVNIGARATGGSSNFSTQIALDSGAKVKREIRVEATSVRKGASAPTETLRAVGASGTDFMAVLAFSKTTQNDVYFTIQTPMDMDTTVPANFHLMWQPGASWTAGSPPPSSNYIWKLEYLVMNENGATLLSGSPTTLSADITPSNATTNIETEFTGNITLAADQMMVCHFYRDVANDNADDVGCVSYFELEYTVNKLGEAV